MPETSTQADTPPPGATGEDSPRAALVGFAVGWLIMLAVILPAEVDRWDESNGEKTPKVPSGSSDLDGNTVVDWLFDWNIDTTPYLFLLLVAPLCWRIRTPLLNQSSPGVRRLMAWLSEGPAEPEAGLSEKRWRCARAWLLATLVGLAAFLSCVRVASIGVPEQPDLAFGDLPPGLHDEFSYLFQAETFLAGRWSFQSHESMPRIFDQMHVLNEGEFASRYFPGTGLWMACFLAFGDPWLGHWLATAVICMLVFGIGRELSCNGVGLLAGLLAAASPGLSLFGNLLLAHQPTLVGLGVFIFAFLRMARGLAGPGAEEVSESDPPGGIKPRWIMWFRLRDTDWICVSGYGLAFAMLCRPMTAAGVGLPFGIWVLVWLIRNGFRSRQRAVAILRGYAVPLLLGFGIIAVHNKLITGNVFQSPYQVYTQLFTPRHMYGFDNVVRAEPYLNSDRIIQHYDHWAINLDAGLAVRNVGYRFLAGWQWTLGLSALIVSGCVFLAAGFGGLRPSHFRDRAGPQRMPGLWWLIPSGIVTLHLAHVPYWYDGILHWHYVFESSVLWCLVAAAATLILLRAFRVWNRHGMSMWWGAVLLISVLVNNVAVSPFWTVSRIEAGTGEFRFARQKQFDVRSLVEQTVTARPALVLVRHDPSERHIDYVSNHPSLTGPVLVGRLPMSAAAGSPQLSDSELRTVRAAVEAFPDRAVYILDAVNGRVERVR